MHSMHRHLHKAVQDTKEENDAADPEMDPPVLGRRLCLLILHVMHETKPELDQQEADDDEANDLMRRVEFARLCRQQMIM